MANTFWTALYPCLESISKNDTALLGALLAFSAGALVYVGATHLLPQAETEHKKYSLLALGGRYPGGVGYYPLPGLIQELQRRYLAMRKKNDKINNETRKAQMEVQNREIAETLSHIKNKILVMSGKGGVGKSSVAAYLSVALAGRGYKVGLMDVDLHGPSIPRILGLSGSPGFDGYQGKMLPIRHSVNLEVISIEILMGENKDAATIWRGPLKIGAIRQFISDIQWRKLDYLVIDSPPGTGDEPLTVAQTIPDARALIVTTPQEISLADVRKSINFCRQVKMEILGLVENMSGLKCPYCGKIIEVFKTLGGRETARKENLRLLATLPLELEVVREGDAGVIRLLDNPEIPLAREFSKMVDEIVRLTAGSFSTAPSKADRQTI